MLVEFRMGNYGCFRDEQTLSMVASPDDSLPDNTITPQGESKLRLLRSAVVYGANASGKTKLLDALMFLRNLVVSSASARPDDPIGVYPFLLDSTQANEPSFFEITFIQQKVRYRYGLVVDRKRVHREWLYAAPKRYNVKYYERFWNPETNEEDYVFGNSLRGQNAVIRKLTRSNELFLSAAASAKHSMLTEVYHWFQRSLGGIQATQMNKGLYDEIPSNEWLENHHEQIKRLLTLADLGILDYRLVETSPPESLQKLIHPDRFKEMSQTKWYEVEMLHQTADHDPVALSGSEESAGTRQLFDLGPWLLEVIAKGRVVVVDELDASLHPLLARALVKLFHDPAVNKYNAQLIFNTHDVTLLDRELFRRDQIWFTEKDRDGAAHLYSLAEFRPRKDEAWAKGYLQGRYGAIPYLGNPSSLFFEEEC